MKYSVLCIFLMTLMLPMTNVFAQETTAEPATTVAEMLPEEAPKKKKDKKDELTEEQRAHLAFIGIRTGDLDMAKKYMFPQMVYEYDKDGENILTLAIASDNVAMVDFVEQHSIINRKNKAGETPLTLALKKGNPEILHLIMHRAKASLKNDLGELPIVLALEESYDLKTLQLLINKGAELNARANGITPLSRAVELNKLPAVALFLKNGADPSMTNEDGTIPLALAVQQNQEAIAGLLLNRSDEPSEDANWENTLGEPIIVLAAFEGKTGIVKTLVYFGADVNAMDYMDNTALTMAAKRGNAPVMEFLVENGADIDHENMLGFTPVLIAAESGHYAAANYLANNGANIENRSYSGIAATDFYSFTSSTDEVETP
ncbi:MAG: ankyrin repeat domain-containing protein [Bacteroidota bacterium]